jgi:hypothetical protein
LGVLTPLRRGVLDTTLCDKVGGFLQFPPPIKTDWHDITELLLKVVLNIKIPL